MEKNTQKQVNETQQALVVSAKVLAKLLGVSIRQVWRLNSAGKLPKHIRLGGSVRWRRDEIMAFIEAGAPDRAQWESMRGGTA